MHPFIHLFRIGGASAARICASVLAVRLYRFVSPSLLAAVLPLCPTVGVFHLICSVLAVVLPLVFGLFNVGGLSAAVYIVGRAYCISCVRSCVFRPYAATHALGDAGSR